MQIECFRAKIMFVIAIIGAIATIGTLSLGQLQQKTTSHNKNINTYEI